MCVRTQSPEALIYDALRTTVTSQVVIIPGISIEAILDDGRLD